MTQAPSFDASIPVLTEILYAADNAEVAAEMAPEPEPMASTMTAAIDDARCAPEPSAAKSAKPDQKTWNRLEQQLSERILNRVQQRMTIVLEQRMTELLQHALQGLSEEICRGLQANMTHIVAQEMEQVKSELKAEMNKQ
jgi:hypothetical protein